MSSKHPHLLNMSYSVTLSPIPCLHLSTGYSVFKRGAHAILSLLLLVLFVGSHSACARPSAQLSDTAKIALDSLHRCRYMALTRGIGVAGTPSKQFVYANQLSRHTTTDQLVDIANTDTSHIARLWAFRVLLYKGDTQVLDVLRQAFSDTTHVEFMSGCSGYDEPYNRAAIIVYGYDHSQLKLSESLRNALDSLIFFDYSKPQGFADGLVIDFKPYKTYYPTVVEQADKGNDAVLPLLAKYKNPNDRGRMNRLLKANMKREGTVSDAGCEAVTTWNDPSFEWYAKAACHAALSQQDAYVDGILPLLWAYPSPWSRQLFQKLLSPTADSFNREEAIEFLSQQAKTHPIPPTFRPLYERYVRGRR